MGEGALGAAEAVKRSPSLLAEEGGEVINAADKAVGYAGQVIGPAPPGQGAIKFNYTIAPTGDPSCYPRLSVKAQLSNVTHRRIGLFGVHNTDAYDQTSGLGAAAEADGTTSFVAPQLESTCDPLNH